MSKSQKYVVKATVEHHSDVSVSVELEGSGFLGRGKSYSISTAFSDAYADLMAKVAEAIFTEDKLT